MYARYVDVDNLRSFREGEIDLLYPGRRQEDRFNDISRWPPRLPNVNILLGENGSGKSTILEAIALGLLSPVVASSGYRPYALIRRSDHNPPKRAIIETGLVLHREDGAPRRRAETRVVLETLIERRGDLEYLRTGEELGPVWEGMFHDDSLSFFVVGYGATRRVEAISAQDMASRRRIRGLRYARVASLFEDHFALTPLNAWLPELEARNPDQYRQVVNLLNRLSPPNLSFTGKLEAGDYLFRHRRSTSVPFLALSDGYRAYIGWIGDLLYNLCAGLDGDVELTTRRGVVLVDEIDLHIHPAWQRTIIPTLARTLKNLQFVFTTHSPIVVGTMERANINTVEREAGQPMVSRPDDEILGLTADQILRSDAFRLESTRDPEFRQRLVEISKDVLAGKPGAAIQFMREAALGQGGATSPEEPPPPQWLRSLGSRSKT